MLKCPMCKKVLRGIEKECPFCRCDVSLLADYVQHLRDGLIQAEAYTRKGELGEAVWSYLSVLEIDPDNNTARRQIGKVVTAVRQFDLMPPARRLLRRMRFRRWMGMISEDGEGSWRSQITWFVLLVLALVLGFFIGQFTNRPPAHAEPETTISAPP